MSALAPSFDARTSAARRAGLVPILVAAVALPCLAFLIAPYAGAPAVVVVLGIAHLLLGTTAFVLHGGPALTAAGSFQLTGGILVGAGALLMATIVPESSRSSSYGQLVAVLWPALLVHAAIAAGTVFTDGPGRRAARWAAARSRAEVRGVFARSNWPLSVAVGLLGTGTVGVLALPGAAALFRRVGFVGSLLVATTAIARLGSGRAARRSWLGTAVVLAATLGFFFVMFFQRYGRLVLVSLAFAVALTLNLHRPRRWHKAAILAAILPGLLLAGILRFQTRTDVSQRFDNVVAEAAGLESVYRPLDSLAELVAIDRRAGGEGIERRNGGTFVGSALFFVPRRIWPGKPLGFGFELGMILRPQYAVNNYSASGLHFAEWYVNFGWWGWVLAVPAFAVALRWLDRRLFAVRRHGVTRLPLATLALAVVTTGILDFVWNNSFTFAARAGLRLAVLVAAFLVVRLALPRPQAEDGSDSPSSVSANRVGVPAR